jgi:uncharacterized cysteine cluster protein YcgN (CxxCxxCC family)
MHDKGPRFWETTALAEMTPAQWESLCDGCAQCCLHKLEDAYSGRLFYTSVACRLLDAGDCRCTRYAERAELVPDCVVLSPANIGDLAWLPETCAYRLLDEGRALPPWHPLLSGDPDSVHDAGVSVRGRVVSEEHVHLDDIERFIIARA